MRRNATRRDARRVARFLCFLMDRCIPHPAPYRGFSLLQATHWYLRPVLKVPLTLCSRTARSPADKLHPNPEKCLPSRLQFTLADRVAIPSFPVLVIFHWASRPHRPFPHENWHHVCLSRIVSIQDDARLSFRPSPFFIQRRCLLEN